MRVHRCWFQGVVAVAIGSILVPAPSFAVQPAAAAIEDAPVRDIALGEGGAWRGQLVDPAGRAITGVVVSVSQHGQQVAAATTDSRGGFAITGLRGGSHELVAGQTRQSYRLWAAGTAPPTATPGALLVRDASLARAQLPAGSWETLGAIGVGALIVGGVVAIAQSDSGS